MVAESIVARKSFGLALEIIEICRALADEREYVLSRQLLKSGTSIGATFEQLAALRDGVPGELHEHRSQR